MKKKEKLKTVVKLSEPVKEFPELDNKLRLNKETIVKLNNFGMSGENARAEITTICSPFPITTWTVTCFICPGGGMTEKDPCCSVSKYTYCGLD